MEAKQYTKARDTLLTAIELYMEPADDSGIASARAALGQRLMGVGEWAPARDNLHRALCAARRTGNIRLHVEAHLQLGRLDWREGDFDAASFNWSRATRLSEHINDPLLEARV